MNVIKPSEVSTNKPIPQFVLDVVNDHLKEHYRGKELIVKVPDITDKIKKLGKHYTTHDLDFEYLYNEAGWSCKFIKTPYYEPFDYWIFNANN